jgi:hypothetical protein
MDWKVIQEILCRDRAGREAKQTNEASISSWVGRQNKEYPKAWNGFKCQDTRIEIDNGKGA